MDVVIVHGCSPRDDKIISLQQWMFWLKKELENKGVETFLQDMPEPWEPKYEEWKNLLDRLPVNESTVLIGHSCGGGFVVRWLGETEKKVRKLILVAPAIIHGGGYKPFENLLKFKINSEVSRLAKKITIFVSDDDSEMIRKSAEIFHKKVGGRIIKMRNHGHFMFKDMKTEKFPELLEEVLK